jgi:GT2 family glycosyltransferase
MKTRLAVVILNWNGKKYLEKFLPVLLQHCPEYAEVVVADNASSDDSVSFLEECFPSLRIIQNGFNGGFLKDIMMPLSKSMLNIIAFLIRILKLLLIG